jgi:hypothetical protein
MGTNIILCMFDKKNIKPSMITEDLNQNPLTQLINKFIHSVNHRSVLGKKKI